MTRIYASILLGIRVGINPSADMQQMTKLLENILKNDSALKYGKGCINNFGIALKWNSVRFFLSPQPYSNNNFKPNGKLTKIMREIWAGQALKDMEIEDKEFEFLWKFFDTKQ